MKLRSVNATCIVLGCLVAGPALADTFQVFAGSNVNGPTWNRPVDGGPTLSGRNVHYSAQRFAFTASTHCRISSTQEFSGYIHLYAGNFDPNDPLNNLIGGNNNGALGTGSSQLPDSEEDATLDLAAGVYTLVTSGFAEDDMGEFQNLIQCERVFRPVAACFFPGTERDKNACLLDRFAVIIDQVTNHPTDGTATPVRFASRDSAFFWFFNPNNYEALVKVLNGCAVNGHYWVFTAGTTNQGHRVFVADTVNQTAKAYVRTLGPPAPAVTDTLAFPCQ